MPEQPPTDPSQLLRDRGLSVTAPRLAVLREVGTHPHATAEEIEAAVRSSIGAVSRQAVYDGLGTLTEHGLLRRIQPARSPARYEARVADNHHHLVCRGCGRTEDVDCAVGYRPCLTASESHGFQIDEAEVIYWGVCPVCAGGADPATHDPISTTPIQTSTNTR
ncbi:MAG: transcriptional repressor [Acidimicrobiaceae bacterium]|nr:transcriptional repressor [Ilumatobacter sp.]MCB9381091.1 transcriptional repressor [Acidimicrobiaceae bacterium]MCO5328472.1 transcriptional repressor [Ilumatobacteraceae bacterium]